MFSLIVLGLLQAALPVDGAMPPEVALADEISSPSFRVAVVSLTPSEGRCIPTRLLLSPTGRQALTHAAAPGAQAAKPVESATATTLVVDGTRLGRDDQQRRCRESVKMTLALTPRRPPPAVGSSIVLAVTGPGFVVEAAGVVIPCRATDRGRHGAAADVVCARSTTGRTFVGVVDDTNGNTLVVTP